jgi:hypothetical protein
MVDSIGYIYVNGSTYLNASDPMKFCTIKYSNSGNLLWVRRDSTHLAGQDTYMAIDRDGFVYVGGEGCPVAVGRCQDDRQTVIKYDSSGNKQWQISGNRSQFHNFLLDKNFNIYITSGGNQLIVEKYSQLVSINNRGSNVPAKLILFQNYPNPFNPTTKIEFEIPFLKESEGMQYPVTLKIYDILGKEVETLVDKKLNPGDYEILWDASRFPSGVYFYCLSAHGYNESKKLVLIK